MAEKNPKVGKLLRVLVAGGVALAGAAGAARAEDQPTSTDKAVKAAQQSEQHPAAKEKAKAKPHHEHAKDKAAEKAKAKAEAKAAESDGGGVKGW